MKADHLSYKKATTVALMGLGLQLVLGLSLLIYSIIFRDTASFGGAIFILAGSIVWLTLTIVFDQHRRERLEALEAESLALASARESSVFGDRPDDLRIAAKRLAWMHKYLVNAAALIFAGVLVALGFWTFGAGRAILAADQFQSLRDFGWAISIGLTLAFVGFVFARYTSALSKQPGWAALCAGAAQAAGISLIGLAIVVAQFIDYAGPDVVARYLIIAIPIVMFVIAAETVINFLLGLYVPRRPGEIPRPAFESRILGFIAAPDKIAESIGGALNYQFGFDVTGSWFYQLLSRSLVALVLVGLVVMWSLTTIGIVQPNEQGLRVRFGDKVGGALKPGPYLKLPWPLERIERFDAATARRVNLGSDPPKVAKSILWTNDHGGAENYFVVQPTARDIADDPERSRTTAVNANDVSLVSAEVPLIYEVTDLAAFEGLAAPDQREQIIQGVARREVFTYLATRGLGAVLGEGRTRVSAALHKRVEDKLNELNAGVRVLHVGIEGVHPPKDTAEVFEEVVQGLQKRAGGIDNGQREANKTLIAVVGSVETAREIVKAIEAIDRARGAKQPAEVITRLELDAEALIASASGSAAATLQQAKAERWSLHMKARGFAEQYAGQLASYDACPPVYMAQRYFDTLRDMVKDSRVYIVGDDAGVLEIDTDLKEAGISSNLFDRPKKDGE